ncbi:hypothetical protein P8452_14076 [Trifolium repens]|nr:hypothetical protein P8452_14076 [Trifolium repens]
MKFRETNKIVLYFIVLFSSEKRTAFLLQNRSLLHRNPNQNRFTSSPRVSFYFIATLTQNPSTSSPQVSFYISRRSPSRNRRLVLQENSTYLSQTVATFSSLIFTLL